MICRYSYDVSEPNIEELVSFDKSNTSRRKALSYSNKQLIAREIELEKLRRFESAKRLEAEETSKKNRSESTKDLEKTSRFTRDFGTPKNTDESQLPNHLQTLKVKTVKVQSTVSLFYNICLYFLRDGIPIVGKEFVEMGKIVTMTSLCIITSLIWAQINTN